ncbi:hypothetical protein H6790_00630 [Candidatus Nomurabacteria bacterium]|nr:hypothetical protein [Candidatus Nomurabacteria bacterium]
MPQLRLKFKKYTVLTLILVFLFGNLIPLASTHAGEIDLHEAFLRADDPDTDNHYQEYLTTAASLSKDEVGGTVVKFDIAVGPNGEGMSPMTWNADGTIDDVGGWYPVYKDQDEDVIVPQDSDPTPSPGGGSYGVYVDIGTSHEIENYSDIYLIHINKIDTVTDIVKTVGITDAIFSNPAAFTAQIANIEYYVTGLEKNTTYYAQVRIEERDSNGVSPIIIPIPISIDSTAFSSVIEFKTTEEETALDTTVTTDGGTFVAASEGNTENPSILKGLECSINVLKGEFQIGACVIAGLAYIFWALFQVSALLLTVAAGLMDVFINFSLSSIFYSGNSFVNEGWRLVRDVVNIFFIISLLWTAISIILGLGQGRTNPYKQIAAIIIVAILINFSLLLSKIVVDSGNALGRIFYNSIEVTGVKEPSLTTGTGLEEVSVSKAIVKGLNITKIINTEAMEGLRELKNTNTAIIFIIILAIAINVIAIIAFLKISMAFVGRIGGIWLAMILSPFAFVSKIIPGGDKLGDYSFGGWFSNLLKVSFMAPIFLFFLYLIILVINSNFINGLLTIPQDGQAFTFFQFIIIIFVQVLLIIGLLNKAKDVSIKMAGEVAGQVAGAVRGLLVTAGLAAVGGAALLGRGAAAGASAFGKSGQRAAAGTSRNGLDRRIGNFANNTNYTRGFESRQEKINALKKGRRSEKTFDKYSKQFTNDPKAKYKDLSEEDKLRVIEKMQGKLGVRETSRLESELSNYNNMSKSDKRKAKLYHNASSGSYDIRDLANVKQWYLKMPAIAIRELFKNASVETGKAQKNFWKDIGEAIKKGAESADIKLNIDTSSRKIKEDEDKDE